MMKIINKAPYCLGLRKNTSDEDINILLKIFSEAPEEEAGILGGRGKTAKTLLNDNRSVVVKYYNRGGLLRHFIKRSYLKAGRVRPRIEYEMLEHALKNGISVPEPIAWAIKGRLIYQGWLVTKEIENATSLADYSLAETGEQTEKVVSMAADQVNRLIQNRILHVDLHPGNILYDGKTVFVIDFDKSEITNCNKKNLIDFYLERWHRAVKKYQLPGAVSIVFEKVLRQHSH